MALPTLLVLTLIGLIALALIELFNEVLEAPPLINGLIALGECKSLCIVVAPSVSLNISFCG